MRFKLIIFSVFFTLGLGAQNLVENGSFENTGNCPIQSTDFEDFLAPWTYFGTAPEYYHPCGFPGSDSATDNSLPFDGAGFVGINVYGETAPGSGTFRRDYIHGQLTEPLDSGKFYRISFYVKPLNNDTEGYSYGVNNIGLLLTDTILDSTNTSRLLDFNPQVVETDIITQDKYWTAICGIIKAKGGEEFITIGNFSPDVETSFAPLDDASNPQFSFMMVDYVEVVENDLPQLPADTMICDEDRIDLVVEGPDISVTWSDESTDSRFIITRPGTYSARISNGVCSYTDSIIVDEVYCQRCEIYAPTAFTPNGDGLNEEFEVTPNCLSEGELLDFSIKIFDRWGRKVFESVSPEVSWDGEDADYAGIYTYTIEYSYSNKRKSKTEIKRGFFTLIK